MFGFKRKIKYCNCNTVCKRDIASWIWLKNKFLPIEELYSINYFTKNIYCCSRCKKEIEKRIKNYYENQGYKE